MGIFAGKSGSALLSVSFWTRKHDNPKIAGSHLGNKKKTMKPVLWKVEQREDRKCMFNDTVELRAQVLLKFCPNSELREANIFPLLVLVPVFNFSSLRKMLGTFFLGPKKDLLIWFRFFLWGLHCSCQMFSYVLKCLLFASGLSSLSISLSFSLFA